MTDHHDDNVRTVTVEFLRPGPPRNQLLSPLTRYLGVCGDEQVGEVTVQYEHSEFVRRLRDLRYRADGGADPDGKRGEELNRERQAALLELSKEMSRFLAAVPGLAKQLASRSCQSELVHLQFIISAAELAMLPLELAGPLEQPGADAGNYLQLGARPRVSMTRRSRGMNDRCIRWPREPRILFVAANPVQWIPYEAHVDALVASLQPWLPSLAGPTNDEEGRERTYSAELSRHLVLLKQASITKIAELCAEDSFTHVHVLAHGASDPASPGRHFGLALHSDDDKSKVHVVSGSQFASAIRRDGGGGGPTVVTLASCDSANVHDVMYTGASFAHDLQRSGVPVVVASQFPLTVQGSHIFVRELYKDLLLGADPRELLADVRLRLHSAYASVAHDWASLVAYAVFPPDLSDQLEDTKYLRARRAVEVALDSLDRELSARKSDVSRHPLAGDIKRDIFKAIDAAVKLLPRSGKHRAAAYGLIAATEKRKAEFCFRACGAANNAAADGDQSPRREEIALLERAMENYSKAFREGAQIRPHTSEVAAHWAITQEVSLKAVLTGEIPRDRWSTASELAQTDARTDPKWPLTSLIDLTILRWWIFGEDQTSVLDEQVDDLIAGTRDDKFPLHSTERQVRRYSEWWWTDDFRATSGPEVPVPPEALRAKLKEIVERIARARRRGEALE